MHRVDVGAYLARLGVTDPGAPSVRSLRRLHRAHVERVPYENLEIQLGRPTTLDPADSAERIVRQRRGGYCFHLNGAFSELLLALGYRVARHVGGVQRTDEDTAGVNAGHMAVTVSGLPHEKCPDGVWLVDVGLGSAFHEPLPLREGTYRQGPFRYRLRPSEVAPEGWRLDNDPRGQFVGMDFRREEADVDEFEAMHGFFSTAPESGFKRVAIVQRRHAEGYDVLRGLVLARVGVGESTTILESPHRWYGALAETFGLELEDVTPDERELLWERVSAAHVEYMARNPPALTQAGPAA